MRSKRPPRDVAALSTLVGELMGHVHRRSAGDTLAVLHEAGLTMAQLVALHVLCHRGERSISEMGAALHLSPAATSHLVERLVRAGLVERGEDPEDRRTKRLRVTAAGRVLVERAQAERTREIAGVCARLSREARQSLSRSLGRVLEELAAIPEERTRRS
jgi:DNA-binding MarR family transcriptional regulator